MKLLNLQKEYIRTSGNEIDKLVYKTYDDIKEQYAVLIENALKEATNNHNRSMKAMECVAEKCTETAKKAQESNAKLCRVDNFWKFLNFTAPIYVMIDIIIRIFVQIH